MYAGITERNRANFHNVYMSVITFNFQMVSLFSYSLKSSGRRVGTPLPPSPSKREFVENVVLLFLVSSASNCYPPPPPPSAMKLVSQPVN